MIEPVARIARILALGNRVLVCTGRPERIRAETEAWLKDKVFGDLPAPCMVLMRYDGYLRADDILKEEMLDWILDQGFKPEIVFDDRQRVVDMWRRRGLICAQVAEGAF